MELYNCMVYAHADPRNVATRLALTVEHRRLYGRDDQGRRVARGLELYIAVSLGQLDGRPVIAHVTLLKFRGNPPGAWNPAALRGRFGPVVTRLLEGQSLSPAPWQLSAQRLVLPLDQRWLPGLATMRTALAEAIGIPPPSQVPPGGFHVGLYYVGDIDTLLPRLGAYVGTARANFDGTGWREEEEDHLEPFLDLRAGERVWATRTRADGWCWAINEASLQGWIPTDYWRPTPPFQPPLIHADR